MHLEVLSPEQKDQLSYIKDFSKDFILVGGTAIALYVGHRKSIDFDLFTSRTINKTLVKKKLVANHKNYKLLYEDYDGLHVLINSVKWTFFYYPFSIEAKTQFNGIRIPDLLTLASMKAYALGRRAKWKDYVDLFLLLTTHFSIEDISQSANKIFGSAFTEKLFRQQLMYFEVMDYSEPIEWINHDFSIEEIQEGLKEIATKKL